jgi:hypothetical protein
MLRLSAAFTAALVAAACAQPAAADTGWHFGPLVETWINDCYTGDVVHGVGEYAGAHYDANDPPKTGDVFYVNVVVNGVDASCAEIAYPDIKLPSGVSTAISSQNPITCFKVDNSAQAEIPDTADCPQQLGAPLMGGAGSIRNPNGPPPGGWDSRAPNAWEFRIPLTAKSPGLTEVSFPTQVVSGSITQSLEPTVSLPIAAGAAAARPANTRRPRVTRSGKKLVCNPGRWSNAPAAYAYRWSVDGKMKKGAAARKLTVSRKLRLHAVQCRVTAFNASGRATATSRAFKVR